MSQALQPPRVEGQFQGLFRSLRSRNYRLFFAGQSVSLVGTWMTSTATASLIQYRMDLKQTGGTLGLVAFAARIPAFFMAPLAGVMADRWNLRKLLVGTQTLAMVQLFILAYLAFSTRITVNEIIGLSVFQGLIDGFDMPARQSFVVRMVEKREDLTNAIALNSSMVHMARLVGPAIAAALIWIGMLLGKSGEGTCFLIDGASYLAVIASLVAMAIPAEIRNVEYPPVLRGMKEGVVYAWRVRPIRLVLMMIMVMSIAGTPYITLMPVFANSLWEGHPAALGLLLSASGMGVLCGAVFLAWRKSAAGLERVIPLTAGLAAVTLMAFAFSPRLWVSLPLVVATGASMMVTMASGNTILQTLVDDDKRGRVMSLFAMSFLGAMPIGALAGGWLADRIGAPVTVIMGSMVCLAAAGVFFMQRGTLTQGLAEHARLQMEAEASAGGV